MTDIPNPRKDVKAFQHPFFEETINRVLEGVDMYRLMLHPSPHIASEFAEAWREWVKPCVDLSAFKYAYLGAGSSELIRECARQAKHYRPMGVHALPGEYEGWSYYVEAMGRIVYDMPPLGSEDGSGVVYLSNPQSRDGNWMDKDLFHKIINTHDTIVDMAYINTAPNRRVDVEPANAVIFSASKSLGMFYDRLGIMFTKQPQPALEGNNLWFHNPLSILKATAIMEEFPCGSLHEIMKHQQMAAIVHYTMRGFTIAPSDSFLTGFDRNMDKGYLRPGTDLGNRYCLFPYYEAMRKAMK